MKFKIVSVSNPVRAHFIDSRLRSAQEAAALGWDLPRLGVESLEALDIGEATSDNDGDSWERFE